VLYGLLLVDAVGVPHEHDAALASLYAAANAPIFGMFEDQVGKGIVGGPLFSQERIGRLTGGLARRMLRGESVAREVVGMEKPTYDWRELKRWKIDDGRLPPGSVVRFRAPSLWEEHKGTIVLGLSVLVLQAGLIAALLAQRGHRRRAEHESRELSGRLLTAHEDERRRLARELHDDLTQRLARLAIDAGGLERGGGRSSVEDGTARSMRDELIRLSEDVHALSYQLHPSVLDDLGLVEALKAECDRVSRREPVRVSVEARDVPPELPSDAALCLFRVAQEALRNVVRHARARAVRVSLVPSDGGLRLAVQDDGIGFDPAASRGGPSLGHASMRERVRLIGGELDIDSAPGRGTTVVAWVPLPRRPS
jgi:signal transduction histidine kinase